ncbi:SDR family oxidoreductase [Nocardia blacklockiae]|uniref:SDR family oxidoreductase n=1 Tax=Nocardia blacklockiae TaxID=480036 RepID=UPI001894D03E|nr:SDR family oxidoreductase [Nocardia blacklockiae]MBF6170611.1 SDR family oxidoreductase [Nocardia blacklockiae]
MTDLSHTLVIGGGSGMGHALAHRLLTAGHEVTIAGRSTARLEAAAATLPGERLHLRQVDIADETSVERLFAGFAALDHVVVTAADMSAGYGPLQELPLAAARTVLDIKVLGPWLVAKHAAPLLTGSLTVTSGIAAYRPAVGGSTVATANAALEGLVRALALELAPVRVNAVSPGWVDTPIWEQFAGDAKDERLAAMAARLPVARVGRPDDLAAAFHAVLTNEFLTGTVLHVDGGHRLV